jgi:hypothetical protein
MRGLSSILVVGLMVLATAPTAAAQNTCVKRTDVAALDEYCPALPGADGRGSNAGPSLKRILPTKTVERLERMGAVGKALLALPAIAPEHLVGIAHKARARGLDADELLTQGRLGNKTKPPGNPITATADAVTNGNLGVAFGSVLLISTFGMAGVGWLRFRRRYQF